MERCPNHDSEDKILEAFNNLEAECQEKRTDSLKRLLDNVFNKKDKSETIKLEIIRG